jgi:hypothetical protein
MLQKVKMINGGVIGYTLMPTLSIGSRCTVRLWQGNPDNEQEKRLGENDRFGPEKNKRFPLSPPHPVLQKIPLRC